MPDKMPGWFGLQKLGGELVPCQIDLTEFELSGRLQRVTALNGDGERYGYFVCYTPDLDDMRYYLGSDGSYLPINWPQMYYRMPFSEVPEHEYETAAYVGLLYRPKPDPPVNGTPFSHWWWETSDFVSRDTRAFSVGYGGDGVGYFMGGYVGRGDLRVYRSDEWGNVGYLWWQRPSLSESVSYLINAPGNNGINIGTEADSGPELWWFPEFDASRATRSAHYSNGHMYIFGGAGCMQTGNLICVCGNRDTGGQLARYDNGWPLFTPECRDEENRPLIIWDAIKWKDKWIAGCHGGQGRYKPPEGYHSGRLAILRDGQWDVKQLQPGGTAGILRLTTLPNYDSECLYMTTTYGEVWKTWDLLNFELVFSAERVERNIFLFEIEGRPVCVSTAGDVYEYWQKVLDFSDAYWAGENFCSVLPGPKGVLAGPITSKDQNGFKVLKLRYSE